MTHQNEFELDVTASADGDTLTVIVSGDVDAFNEHVIGGVIAASPELLRVQRVVIDLSGVDFMDSSGLSALIDCRNGVHAGGLGFTVIGARDGTLRLLEITGLLDLFASPREDDVQSHA